MASPGGKLSSIARLMRIGDRYFFAARLVKEVQT